MGLFDRRPEYRSTSPNRAAGRDALRASGQRLGKRTRDQVDRLQQPWQTRSFAYYDLLPEINYASQFYSRALSVLRLYAGERDDDGNVEPTKNDKVKEQLERIQDPGGGSMSGLLGSYGRLMFLAGEAYLFVTKDEDTDQEQWEMLSSDELRPNPGGRGYQRVKAPSLIAENYREQSDDDFEPIEDDEAVAYRLWRRHPRYSALATSTMASVLDVCEELVLLTQAVRSRARSRLAGSGILLVNGKNIPAPVEATADEDINEDPFMRDLIEAMTTPIANEGAASSVVPHVVRVDAEEIDNVLKHIQIIDPTQLYPETGLRYECIKRIAFGLDMPPEILLGMSDANHWSAWMIDEQTWTGHLQPVAQQLVDDLTAAFLQPTLREAKIPDWQRYVIAYDATAVVNHPNKGKDAKDVHTAGALSDAALREATGFTDEDAPSEDERRVWISIKSRDPEFAMTGISGNQTADPAEAEEDDATADLPGGRAEDVEPGPPEEEETVRAAANGNGEIGPIEARVIAAADLAVLRARELAGNRLRSLAKRDKDAAKLIDGVRAGRVASTLGLEGAKAIRAPSERELVAGIRESLVDALRLWDVDEALAGPVGDRVEQHAARTLFDDPAPPLPASFENYVRGLGLDVKAPA